MRPEYLILLDLIPLWIVPNIFISTEGRYGMDDNYIEECVQDVANTSEFEVKEVDHTGDTIHITQTNIDKEATVILVSFLFHCTDKEFEHISIDEHGTEEGPDHHHRSEYEEIIEKIGEMMNKSRF
jgi:hypothetical protein